MLRTITLTVTLALTATLTGCALLQPTRATPATVRAFGQDTALAYLVVEDEISEEHRQALQVAYQALGELVQHADDYEGLEEGPTGASPVDDLRPALIQRATAIATDWPDVRVQLVAGAIDRILARLVGRFELPDDSIRALAPYSNAHRLLDPAGQVRRLPDSRLAGLRYSADGSRVILRHDNAGPGGPPPQWVLDAIASVSIEGPLTLTELQQWLKEHPEF